MPADLDAANLDEMAGENCHEHLNANTWEAYQQIVRMLVDLPDKCEHVLKVDYLTAPDPADKFAAVTVVLPQAAMLDGEIKSAVSAAAQSCDRLYLSAIGGEIRITFTMATIWTD